MGEEDVQDGVRASQSIPAELTLDDYPEYDDIEKWDALFPFQPSVKYTELKSKEEEIRREIAGITIENSSLWPSLRENIAELKDLEDGTVLQRKLDEIEDFCQSVLRNAQEEKHLKVKAHRTHRTIAKSKFGLALTRNIIEATKRFVMGLDNELATWKDILKEQERKNNLWSIEKKQEAIRALENEFANGAMVKKQEAEEHSKATEQQLYSDEEQRKKMIELKREEIKSQREAQLKEKELIEKLEKETHEREVDKILNSAGHGRHFPIHIEKLPQSLGASSSEEGFKVKDEEEEDEGERILNLFNKENKEGRLRIREERRAEREDNARRRRNGESVPEDDPYRSDLDGVFSDEEQPFQKVMEYEVSDEDIGEDEHSQQPQDETPTAEVSGSPYDHQKSKSNSPSQAPPHSTSSLQTPEQRNISTEDDIARKVKPEKVAEKIPSSVTATIPAAPSRRPSDPRKSQSPSVNTSHQQHYQLLNQAPLMKVNSYENFNNSNITKAPNPDPRRPTKKINDSYSRHGTSSSTASSSTTSNTQPIRTPNQDITNGSSGFYHARRSSNTQQYPSSTRPPDSVSATKDPRKRRRQE